MLGKHRLRILLSLDRLIARSGSPPVLKLGAAVELDLRGLDVRGTHRLFLLHRRGMLRAIVKLLVPLHDALLAEMRRGRLLGRLGLGGSGLRLGLRVRRRLLRLLRNLNLRRGLRMGRAVLGLLRCRAHIPKGYRP